ncbi:MULTISPECIES: hypothetical protein [unclassified Rhodococcus (in: high G+C Gram-positive bacteria)]|jgi:hypothetical protein|uniref:hypothetical protein n=1 Tax=unclassified Rhodococcus (in: high G+C Gram-positive bacteria) TaxID=192944 RepID=UPI00036D5619|nr:hypothetical protein [Rhodococcus sp. DK17]
MSVFWMVEVLMVTLAVIGVSLAAAVTADAVSRRPRDTVREPDRAEVAGDSSASPVLTARAVRRDRDWHRVANRAWTVCIAASVIAVSAVGLLIIVG